VNPDEKPIIDIGGGTKRAYEQLVEAFPVIKRIIIKLNSRNGRIGLVIAAVAICAAIFWANWTADTKNAMYLDVQRVSNLEELKINIEDYYQNHKSLPENIKDIEEFANPNFVRDWYMFDPMNKQLFYYKVTDNKNYQLCANFTFSSKDVTKIIPIDISNPIWDHKKGHQCFYFQAPDLKVNDKILPPSP
jgi:hypothetical protein